MGSTTHLPAVSASQALSAQSSPNNYVSAGSDAVNALLGGHGFSKRAITDISGPPSSGKTAIATRAAAHASSAGHKVLWIDTACTLPPNRLLPLSSHPDKITYLHLPTLAHLIAFFQRPPPNLEFSLLVLDELSTPYLLAFPPGLDTTPAGKKASQRRYPIMVSLAHLINTLATRYNAAVIVLQKSVTRVVPGFGGVLAPAVGFRGWIDAVGWRVVLYRREGGRRCGSLLKARGRVYEEGEGPEMEIVIGQYGAIVNKDEDQHQPEPQEEEQAPEEQVGGIGRDAVAPLPLESPRGPTPSPLTPSPPSPSPPPIVSASVAFPTVTSSKPESAPPEPSPPQPPATPQQQQEHTTSNQVHSNKRKRGIEVGVIPDSEDEDEEDLLLE